MEKTKKPPDSIEDLKKQLNRTNQIVVDTLSELKQTKEDRDALIEENKNLKKRVTLPETSVGTGTESLRKDMQKMKTTIEEQRQHLLDKAGEIERLNGQLRDAEKRVSEAETVFGSDELAKRQSKITQLENLGTKRGKEAAEYRQEIERERTKYRDEVKLRDDKIVELKNAITNNEKFLMEKNEQLQQFQINGERSYHENRELDGKVNALQKQLDEVRDHAKKQLDEAYGRVNDHMVRVSQLEKRKKEAHQKYKQTVEHYENNIRTLEGKIKTLTSERDDLRDRYRDEVKLRDDKIVELKNAITNNEKFLMKKNEQLQQFEINGERSYHENRELDGKVNALQKQLDEVRDHAKKQLDEAYGRVNDHMVRVSQLEKGKKEAHQKYKQTVEHYENNIRTLEGKIKTLTSERMATNT